MKEFNTLCKEVEKLNAYEYTDILARLSLNIIPALSEIAEDDLDGLTIFSTFILGAVVADGKLSKEEYLLTHPMFEAFFGTSVDYDTCRKLLKAFKEESRELKTLVDDMVDIFGLLSEELKSDIIIVCLLICAIDGKISMKEKNWIKQLMD